VTVEQAINEPGASTKAEQNRNIKDNNALAIHENPFTIMYLDCIFLCSNFIKIE
jgi:hypothetical protein